MSERLRAARGRHPLRRRRLRRPPAPVTGEVVFNTAMSGYQESVTDPSLRRPDHHFTYPHIGNYGVSARGDGVRPHPRARRDHARARSTARTRPAPRAAGSTGCATAACRRSPASTRARSSATSATRGAMRGGIFPGALPEARGAGARRGRAADGRPRPRPRGHARRAVIRRRQRRRPADRRASTPGIKDSIVDNLRARGARVELHPCTASRRASCWPRPRRVFLANGPGDPAALDYVVETVRALVVGKCRCAGSASATSCCAARSAWRPTSCRSATAAPTTRSRTSRPAASRSRRQNHGFAVLGPDGGQRIEADEPVRWETDFGAAELSHVNLYDRTVEGLRCSTCPAPRSSTTPRPAPARTTPCYLFDRFLDAGRMPRRDDIDKILVLGSRADRDRPGGRVRLLRRAGVQGAAGGGLRRRPRQLQPGDDHDRPRVRHRDLRRAAAPRAGRADHRARAPRRAAADAGRPDRAEPGQGPGRERRARPLRGRAHRRATATRSTRPRTATCSGPR